MKFLAGGLVAYLAASLAPASSLHAQSDRYRQRVDTTLSLERGGTLSVSVYSGRVNVVGGSGSQVRVRGTSEEPLEIRSRATSVSISPSEDNAHGERTELDITVPIGTRVVVEGFSAPSSVRGVKGEAKVETMSGDIVVSDAVGNVNVEAVSGSIDIDHVDGDVAAEAVSGHIAIANIKGDVEMESVSGRLSITGAHAHSVRAETVSANVSYDGTFDDTGNYTFKTHSGRITLGLPAGTGASVSLQTFSGNVESDFPVTMESGQNKGLGRESRYEFTIGNGRSRIVTETFSGDIRIQRGTTTQSRDQQ